MFKADPGECPVCGVAHAACTAGDRRATVTTVMTPARDASWALEAERVQAALPEGQVTTGTYRGTKKR